MLVETLFVVQELGEGAIDGPAETAFLISVDGFEDEQDGANFENGGADERGDAATIQDLIFEFTARADEREPGEETVDDPDDGAEGEDHGDQVGDVPIGEIGAHADEALEGSAEGGCSRRRNNVGLVRWFDN